MLQYAKEGTANPDSSSDTIWQISRALLPPPPFHPLLPLYPSVAISVSFSTSRRRREIFLRETKPDSPRMRDQPDVIDGSAQPGCDR